MTLQTLYDELADKVVRDFGNRQPTLEEARTYFAEQAGPYREHFAAAVKPNLEMVHRYVPHAPDDDLRAFVYVTLAHTAMMVRRGKEHGYDMLDVIKFMRGSTVNVN